MEKQWQTSEAQIAEDKEMIQSQQGQLIDYEKRITKLEAAVQVESVLLALRLCQQACRMKVQPWT